MVNFQPFISNPDGMKQQPEPVAEPVAAVEITEEPVAVVAAVEITEEPRNPVKKAARAKKTA